MPSTRDKDYDPNEDEEVDEELSGVEDEDEEINEELNGTSSEEASTSASKLNFV